MAIFAIYCLFVIAFFANYVVDLDIIPPHATAISEILIYLLFIYTLITKLKSKYNLDLLSFYMFFVLCALCSIVVNGYFNFKPILA